MNKNVDKSSFFYKNPNPLSGKIKSFGDIYTHFGVLLQTQNEVSVDSKPLTSASRKSYSKPNLSHSKINHPNKAISPEVKAKLIQYLTNKRNNVNKTDSINNTFLKEGFSKQKGLNSLNKKSSSIINTFNPRYILNKPEKRFNSDVHLERYGAAPVKRLCHQTPLFPEQSNAAEIFDSGSIMDSTKSHVSPPKRKSYSFPRPSIFAKAPRPLNNDNERKNVTPNNTFMAQTSSETDLQLASNHKSQLPLKRALLERYASSNLDGNNTIPTPSSPDSCYRVSQLVKTYSEPYIKRCKKSSFYDSNTLLLNQEGKGFDVKASRGLRDSVINIAPGKSLNICQTADLTFSRTVTADTPTIDDKFSFKTDSSSPTPLSLGVKVSPQICVQQSRGEAAMPYALSDPGLTNIPWPIPTSITPNPFQALQTPMDVLRNFYFRYLTTQQLNAQHQQTWPYFPIMQYPNYGYLPYGPNYQTRFPTSMFPGRGTMPPQYAAIGGSDSNIINTTTSTTTSSKCFKNHASKFIYRTKEGNTTSEGLYSDFNNRNSSQGSDDTAIPNTQTDKEKLKSAILKWVSGKRNTSTASSSGDNTDESHFSFNNKNSAPVLMDNTTTSPATFNRNKITTSDMGDDNAKLHGTNNRMSGNNIETDSLNYESPYYPMISKNLNPDRQHKNSKLSRSHMEIEAGSTLASLASQHY